MKTVSVKLPDPLDAKLGAVARRHRRTKGMLIRDVLEQHFGCAKKPLPRASCYDLLRDLAGTCEGPPDLSYNKAYMKGFGQ